MKARSVFARLSLLTAVFLSASFSASLGGLAGCGEPDSAVQFPDEPGVPPAPGMPTMMPAPTEPLDYYRDAKPLFARYCTGCHTAGGIAPFSLEGYEAAKTHAAASQLAIESGRMPPWLPSDISTPLRYSRALPKADRDELLRWIKEGMTEGDPRAAPRTIPAPAETVPTPRADLIVDPGVAYTPDKTKPDDYRCFIIDPLMTADKYLRAAAIKPGTPALVHHVILFEILAKDAPGVRAKDDKEAGPGYTCFGGPGTSNTQFVFGWAPGGTGLRLPDDEGLIVHKGSLLVMQVHYNLLQYKPGDTDRTTATIEWTDSKPPFRAQVLPLANPGQLKIPAGKKDVTQIITVPVGVAMSYFKIPGDELVISGNMPHMHMLGTAITTRIGSTDQALVDIPRWDFHWQGGYIFREPLKVRKTDTISLQCTYDNTYANQPVVNGEKQMPRDVKWGEGTLDEMCLSFVTLRMPNQ